MMPKTKKLVLMAILAAAALGIFVIEAQIPMPLPGIRPGLANVITLCAMLILSRRDAGAILIVRVLLGSLLTGGVSALLYSAAGAAAAYAVMCALLKMCREGKVWLLSALAAIAHNLAQVFLSALITKTPGVLAYAPILVAVGVISGVFTGIAADKLAKAIEKNRV